MEIHIKEYHRKNLLQLTRVVDGIVFQSHANFERKLEAGDIIHGLWSPQLLELSEPSYCQ